MIFVAPFGLARRRVNWYPVPGRPEGNPLCLVISGSAIGSYSSASGGLQFVFKIRSIMAFKQFSFTVQVDDGAAC